MLFTPSNRTHQVNWKNVDNSTLASQQRVLPSDGGSIIDQIMAGGVKTLHEKVEEGVDLKSVRKKNGMSILHVAASSSLESAQAIVEEIINCGYLDVNDVNGVGIRMLYYVGMYHGTALRSL